MNFKKYHVSRNSWDNRGFSATQITSNHTHNISNNYGTTLSTTEGDGVTITQSAYPTGNVGYQNGFFMIDVDFSKYAVGDVVTISFDYIVNEIHALSTQTATTVYAGKNSNTVPAILSSGDWKVSGRLTAVITIIADMNPYVEVRLCGNSITVKNIMLNEGGTALPYEPYSSEVWHDTPHYIHNTSTDTITTLPAVIHPTDATATVGLKGQTIQSSIPSPTSPIMSKGTGERTGNLVDSDTVYSTYKQSDGMYRGTVNNFYTTHVTPFTSDDIGKTFTFTMVVKETTSTNVRASANINGTAINGNNLSVAGTTTVTFTVSSVNDYLYLGYGGGGANPITLDNIMLNLGSTALPYEPYGYKIPISSGGVTTNIYLGSTQTVRQIKKLVLTGEENWYMRTDDTHIFYIVVSGMRAYSQCISSHYKFATRSIPADLNSGEITTYLGQGIAIWTKNDGIETVNDYKYWLSQQYANGTPVTIWYVLATPTTGIVNEPLMKIGDYADEVSGITIPVTAGGDTLSVETTVQPSEVTVNYKGWHPVADVHERENGQWD